MSLTHLDCHVYRGELASAQTSTFVALNPCRQPGSLVVAGARAISESIGSQVACKLSVEHFIEGVLDFFDKPRSESEDSLLSQETSSKIIQNAFKRANTSVYNFGHKLAAGGRLATSFIGLVIEGKSYSAGRVGDGSVYLYRNQELFPFFEKGAEEGEKDPKFTSYLGSNSLVSVEISSIPIDEEDTIMLFPYDLNAGQEEILQSFLRERAGDLLNPGEKLAIRLFDNYRETPFLFFTQLGPKTIYLSTVHKG